MPKRSRLYRVAGLTNRQRRALLEEQQQAPGINEVEDLQRAYGRLFNQVNKYISQLQNITNIGRGLSRRVNDIRKTEGAYNRAASATNLYVRAAGRSIRSLQAFGRETGKTIQILNQTARASTAPVRAIRSYGRSLNSLKGNERPLRAILKILQQTSTVFSRTRRNSEQTRASFDLLRRTGTRYAESFRQISKSAEDSQDIIFLLRRGLTALGRTDFGTQFARTFRTGHQAIELADTNTRRLATTFGLLLRPVGILNNEWRRLTVGRHRRFAGEVNNVYRALRNVGLVFQRLSGASSNFSNNLSSAGRVTGRIFRPINRVADIFGRIGLAIKFVTFTLHGLVELTFGFRRNAAQIYLAFERLNRAAREFVIYIRSSEASAAFPGIRRGLHNLRSELIQMQLIYEAVRTESSSAFVPATTAVYTLDDAVERLNRRLLRTIRLYQNLVPRRGPNAFAMALDAEFGRSTRAPRLTPRQIREGTPQLTTAQLRQQEFRRFIQDSDRQIARIRQEFEQRTRRQITLPTRAQMGTIEGFTNISTRVGDPQRIRNLINQLTQIQRRVDSFVPDAIGAMRQQITRTIAGNIRDTRIGPLLPTRELREGAGTGAQGLGQRRLGPEPGFLGEPGIIQRIRNYAKREFNSIIEEERIRERNRSEVLQRLKNERKQIQERERLIRQEQADIEDSTLFNEMLREQNRRNTVFDRDEEDDDTDRRERRRRRDNLFDDAPGDDLRDRSTRLNSLFGFIRFGEDAEPLFDRLQRRLRIMRDGFRNMNAQVERNNRTQQVFGRRIRDNGIRIFNFGRHLLVLTILLRGAFLFSIITATTAIVYFTARMASAAREADQMRLRLGLSANSFRAWQFVAAESGFAINDLRRLFNRLDEQIVGLTRNNEEQVKTFGKLNITLGDLKNLDIGGIFQLIGTRLQNVANTSERIALATALFGDQAFKALELAARGANNVNNALRQYRDRPLGSPDELRKIRELDAAFKRLQLTLQSVGVTLSAAIADRLIRGLQAFERMLLAIERADPARIQAIIDTILTFLKVTAILITSAIIVKLGAVLGGIVKALTGIGAASKTASSGLGLLRRSGIALLKIFGRQGLATILVAVTLPLIAKALSQIEAFQLDVNNLADSIPEPNTARVDEQTVQAARLRQQGEIQIALFERLRRFATEQDNINRSVAKSAREFADAINLTPRQLASNTYRLYQQDLQLFENTLRDAQREAAALRDELDRRIKFGLDIDANLTRRLEIVLRFIKELNAQGPPQFANAEALGEWLDALERARDRINNFHQAIENSAQAVGRFLTNTSYLFDDFSDGIKEAAKDLARTIIAELQNALIAQPIVNFLTQFLQGGVSNLLGGLFTPTSTGIPEFAQHGGVHQGLTVVGEAGPELVNFRSPARVYPNRDLGSLLGGFNQTNIFNVEGSDAETVTNAIVAAAPLLTEAAKQAMIEDINRPSNVRRALRG